MHKECSVYVKWPFQVASEFIPPLVCPSLLLRKISRKYRIRECFLSWLPGLFSFQQAVTEVNVPHRSEFGLYLGHKGYRGGRDLHMDFIILFHF